MLDFPSKTLESIKQLLSRQQKEVEKNIEKMEEDDPANSPALAETSEPGTDSYIADAHNKILVLNEQLKKTSKSIQNALQKISKGTYGKCEKCNKQIELSRLWVMPTAAFCLSCSKKTSE